MFRDLFRLLLRVDLISLSCRGLMMFALDLTSVGWFDLI